MKRCTKCKEEKPFDCFHKDIKTKGGYSPTCKECRKSQYKLKPNMELPKLPEGCILICELPGLHDYVGYAIGRNQKVYGCLKSRWGHIDYEKEWREIATRVGRPGYRYCILRSLGSNKTMKIHRLVGMAFVPNPNNYDQINHIDGDKLNNDPPNLQWCTPKENVRHAWATGLCKRTTGERHWNCTTTDAQVVDIKNMRSEKYTMQKIADTLGLSKHAVQYAIEKR